MPVDLDPIFNQVGRAGYRLSFVTVRSWPPTQHIAEHSHADLYQLDLFEGLGQVSLNDQTVSMSGFTLCFIPPQTRHSFTASRYGKLRNLGIRVACSADKLARVPAFAVPRLSPHRARRIETGFRGIMEESQHAVPGNVLAVQSWIHVVMVETLRAWAEHEQGGVSAQIVQEACRFLALRHSELVRMRDVARHCGVRADSLSRAFRRHLGFSPREYLLRLRLRQACLLLTSGVSVTAAAEQTGFSSVHYFSRAFRNTLGQSPTLWRREARFELEGPPNLAPAPAPG